MIETIYAQISQIKSVSKTARAAGVSPKRLYQIVNGRAEPRLDELVALEQNGFIEFHGASESCPTCGTTELLCGYGSPGGCCSSVRDICTDGVDDTDTP
jgi:hypothetical protein